MWKKAGLTAAAGLLAVAGYTGIDRQANATKHWGDAVWKQAQERGWVETELNRSALATRSATAVLLGKALGLKQEEVSAFKDAKGQEKAYLDELVKRGVFQANETFHPQAQLTRGQAAKVVVEAFDLTGAKITDFTDIEGWEKPYVETLAANQITTGTTATTYSPKEPLTHMQLVAFVERAYQKSLELEQTVTITKKASVRTVSELERVLDETYRELPDQVELETRLTKKELSEAMREWEMATHPKDNINRFTLGNYSLVQSGGKFILVDRSHKKLSAREIEEGVKRFASEWADEMEGKSEVEKVNGIYHYLYDNYTYAANGYDEMYVGNMWNDTLACNGFSRLAYEMATAAGIKADIVMGDDHLWNTMVVDGESMLFDATSDIYTQQPYWTLGMSSRQHEEALGAIPIYGGSYDAARYPGQQAKEALAEQIKTASVLPSKDN